MELLFTQISGMLSHAHFMRWTYLDGRLYGAATCDFYNRHSRVPQRAQTVPKCDGPG